MVPLPDARTAIRPTCSRYPRVLVVSRAFGPAGGSELTPGPAEMHETLCRSAPASSHGRIALHGRRHEAHARGDHDHVRRGGRRCSSRSSTSTATTTSRDRAAPACGAAVSFPIAHAHGAVFGVIMALQVALTEVRQREPRPRSAARVHLGAGPPDPRVLRHRQRGWHRLAGRATAASSFGHRLLGRPDRLCRSVRRRGPAPAGTRRGSRPAD